MLIGISGRPAAGKETITGFLRNKGFTYNETSKLLREELEKHGKEITRTSMQDIADGWREKHGAGGVMKKFLEVLDLNKNNIIDSLRNVGEAEFLKNNVNDFILIAVDAPRKLRFERTLSRGKESDPKTWEEFVKVDERDNFDSANPMGQQTGKLIEIADFVIVNDEDLNNAMVQIEKIWEKIQLKGKSTVKKP